MNIAVTDREAAAELALQQGYIGFHLLLTYHNKPLPSDTFQRIENCGINHDYCIECPVETQCRNMYDERCNESNTTKGWRW
jgi:hypothetical protein